MELTPLRYFLKTAETLNYTRAAEALFTSRQALCHTLSNLEKELGQPLFVNDRNHLSLTEYGEYLLQAFREPVQAFSEREAQVKEFFRQPTTLQIAFAVSLFPFHLPGIEEYLNEFCLEHPHILLDQRRLTADELVDAVEAGEVDLGCVLQMPTPRSGCTLSVLRSSPVSVGSGQVSPLYGRDRITLEDLIHIPLVGMGSLEKIAKPLWEDCKKQGISLDYRVVPNSIDALFYIQNSIASGFNTFFNVHAVQYATTSSTPRQRSLLEGYTWEVAALCPKHRPNHGAALLLAQFLQEKYSKM